MPTDFATAMRRWFTGYLPATRALASNTITSYRDAFKLLIAYFAEREHVPAGKLTLDHIEADAVGSFLAWLETTRGNTAATRNQLLAAVKSFCGWLQTVEPARMATCQQVIAIPEKKHPEPVIPHLTTGQTRLLLAQPDRSTRRGRRDATLLAVLYDTAARVQELCDLTVRDLRLDPPALAILTGKGSKTRHVPLMEPTAALVGAYLEEQHLGRPGSGGRPVFFNNRGAKLTRGGVAWIVRKHQAACEDPVLAGFGLTPHGLRHSRAVHLYDAGVPLPYIRDILGHVDLATSEVYAKISLEAKRQALEGAYPSPVDPDMPEWNQDPDLLGFLNSL